MSTSGNTRTTLISPFQYFADPTKARPIFNGFIYIGRVDGDPTNPMDQIPIQLICECGGTPVNVTQPVRTGPGGVPIYNGSPAQIVVCRSNYSITLQDKDRVQVYHSPSVQSSLVNQPTTHLTLAAAIADDNSSRDSILIASTLTFFRRAVSQDEFNSYPSGARFTDAVPLNWVAIIQRSTNADHLGLQGGVDENSEIDAIEALFTDFDIDLLGRKILVTSIPGNNFYFNGNFTISDVNYPANYASIIRSGNTNVALGHNSLQGVANNIIETRHGSNNVAIGNSAMPANGNEARFNVAIGTRTLNNAKAQGTKWNVAIGLESLFETNGISDSSLDGTRITAVGANSGRFITGNSNCAFGRNAAQCLTTGVNCVAIGANALSGRGSVKFKNSNDIFNQTPFTSNYSVAVGHSALFFGSGQGSIGIGRRALENGKSDSSSCVAIGTDALVALGSATSQSGKVQTKSVNTGTYSMTTSEIVFTMSSHSIQAGNEIIVRITSGIPDVSLTDAQYYTVVSVTSDTFTVSEPEGIEATGTFTLDAHANNTNQASSTRNIGIGSGAMFGVLHGTNNVAIGANSNAENTGGSANTAIGDVALRYAVGGSNNTAIGQFSLSRYINGNNATSLSNCTGVGNDSFVSGDNQVQLGSSGTTTYAYGAIQDRSDKRDKTDERPISDEFIDFVLSVDWIQFRRDYREKYFDTSPDGKVIHHPKDGSKKGRRFHNGVIAQDLEKLSKNLGIDFAGLQHHAHNGGQDVYSVGYQEFIPLIGRLCQKQQEEIDIIKDNIEMITSRLNV